MNARLCVLWTIYTSHVVTGQNNTDPNEENKPYEFGFNIAGYQHRHERKDQKGLIMGEFGFVTGDGVYHLTQYATDEEGNFKIIKMKNFYIGIPKINETLASTSKSKVNVLRGCSGCLIPVKETKSKSEQPLPISSKKMNKNKSTENRSHYYQNNKISIENNGPNRLKIIPVNNKSAIPNRLRVNSTNIERNTVNRSPQNISYFEDENNYKNYDSSSSFKNIKMNYNKNNSRSKFNERIIIKTQRNGFKMGLKNSNALMELLYKYNYTLTYHSHNEVGDRIGNKNGSYSFIARDGFLKNITYIANEFGFQPNVSLINLTSDATPKEETEKELNKLRGYEFIWFY